MALRNKHFSSREPFKHDDLTLHSADGPVNFLNPTRAHFSRPLKPYAQYGDLNGSASVASGLKDNAETDQQSSSPSKEEPDFPASDVKFLWRSRDNRKGRHALLVEKPAAGEDPQFLVPRPTLHYRHILKTVLLTFSYFPVWDISWVVAMLFTIGSVVWVINGFFAWLPLVDPSTKFHDESYVGGGVTAFIGAIVFFEVGSILLVIEAVNASNSGCFGWAIEQLAHEKAEDKPKYLLRASKHHCRHHHQNRSNFVGKSSDGLAKEAQLPAENPNQDRSWQWFPSWHDLRTHYIHELGFLAGVSQLLGATVFGISGFTALPGIINHLTAQRALDGAYWIPQVIGGCGFIVSGALYMLETQKKWWKPALNVLGWHIAFWNFVGAIGFTLCGALGMAYANSGAQYQASLATFWGSWAFLIGSYLQLYESLDTHPVTEVASKEAFDRAQ